MSFAALLQGCSLESCPGPPARLPSRNTFKPAGGGDLLVKRVFEML